jgi:hypothetical protein
MSSVVRRTAPLIFTVVLLCALPSPAAEGGIRWFKFNQSFITSHYSSDGAFGSIATGTKWHPAKNIHAISCGGEDGELHIGVLDTNLQLEADQMPQSAPANKKDPSWGIVAELPYASIGDGPAELKDADGEAVTFHGYFRLWNEGHDITRVYDSNPHHVFEIHPAWKFTAQGTSFDRPDLIQAMPGFAGYGITKLRPMVNTLKQGKWLRAYVDNGYLYVSLRETSNFFQFPVEVKSIHDIEGGQEAVVDVYTNTDYETLLYEGLRTIITNKSALDGKLRPEDKVSLLGIFGVNLRKLLPLAEKANSEDSAVSAPEALEFFVFGKPKENAVLNSKCKEEGDIQ